MAGNSASQKDGIPAGPLPSGKSQRSGIESGLATDGMKGEHTDSPADAEPTQFTPDQHDKTTNTIAAM